MLICTFFASLSAAEPPQNVVSRQIMRSLRALASNLLSLDGPYTSYSDCLEAASTPANKERILLDLSKSKKQLE